MTDGLKRTVAEMCVGMFLYVLLLGILAVLFRGPLASAGFSTGPVLCGLGAGFVSDVAMLIHMAVIAERAADSRDAGYANRVTVVQSILRKVVFAAVLFFLGSRPQIDAVAMIIGALGLKAGAFLQPAVHRTFSPHKDGNGEDGISEERRKVYGNDEDSGDSAGA